jgi:myo-inositol-1(or 4)-monophosphatase
MELTPGQFLLSTPLYFCYTCFVQYQAFLESSLKEASAIANSAFGKVTGTMKGDDPNQVLTDTDLVIGKLLIDKVKQAYPDHNIIDEEAGVIDNHSEFTWVIDPIDGTSNFAAGVPMYGIMLGLLQNETPLAGGMALPFFEQIVIAERGHGTLLNGDQVFVTKESELINCHIAYHIDGHRKDPQRTRKEAAILGEIVLNIRNMRNAGCEPYDGILVANGKYGGLLNQTAKIWDVVAPQIIIEEAGGVYTDFWGKSMDYSHPLQRVEQNFTLCAASPILHKQLQEIINAH